MRIAIIGSTQEIVGGAEVYLRWALADFAASGHSVGFAFEFPAAHADRATDRGINGLERWCIGELGKRRFFSELRRFAPDVVYLNSTSEPGIELELSRSFRCVLFAHAYYGTCATGTRLHSLPKHAVCQRTFGPACLISNYARGCGIRHPGTFLRSYAHQSQRLRTLSTVNAVIVASRHVRDVFERQGIDHHKIHLVPYPVIGFTPGPAPPTSRPFTNRVLFLGRLTNLKGLTDAVAAVARASRILERRLILQVGGEGPELAKARVAAQAADVETEFCGWSDDARRVALMQQADVLIVPSRWPEPFGMVGVEAGCFGVPAVAYPVGGIPDWLRAGVSGELAEGGELDPDALGDALVRALRTLEHHQSLREGAWRTAAEYSPDGHREKLLGVLRQIVR